MKIENAIQDLAGEAAKQKKSILLTIKGIIVGIMINTAQHAVNLYLDIVGVQSGEEYYHLHLVLAIVVVLVFEATILTLMRILPMIKEQSNRRLIRSMLVFLTLIILSTNLLHDNIILKVHKVLHSKDNFQTLSHDINMLIGTLLYSLYYSVGILFFAIINNVVSRTLSPIEDIQKEVKSYEQIIANKQKEVEAKKRDIDSLQEEKLKIRSDYHQTHKDYQHQLQEVETLRTALKTQENKYHQAVKDRMCSDCGLVFTDAAQLGRAHTNKREKCKKGTCKGKLAS